MPKFIKEPKKFIEKLKDLLQSKEEKPKNSNKDVSRSKTKFKNSNLKRNYNKTQ